MTLGSEVPGIEEKAQKRTAAIIMQPHSNLYTSYHTPASERSKGRLKYWLHKKTKKVGLKERK